MNEIKLRVLIWYWIPFTDCENGDGEGWEREQVRLKFHLGSVELKMPVIPPQEDNH